MVFFQHKWPAILLWPFSIIYAIVICFRNFCYDRGIFKSFKVSCKVVSVGNITTGGTGKTPTTITLAKGFLDHDFKVCILSRGYGRISTGNFIVSDGSKLLGTVKESGDEPFLMANAIKVPVIVDNDRVNGARIAIKKFNPDVIILDDGFQHRRLARDLDIVTFNSVNPVGNGMILPAGPLREPLFNLNRAHVFWYNGNVTKELSVKNKNKPVITAKYAPTGFFNNNGSVEITASKPEIIAFSGLANPDNFKKTLEGMGFKIKMFKTFKDHHNYTQQDINMLTALNQEQQAEYIITTEKDWVKLPHNNPNLKHWLYLKIDIVPQNRENFVTLIKSVSK